MTNKNKIKLVPATDDDPTGEFEISDSFGRTPQMVEFELEVDAPTFDIDDFNGQSTARSRAELKIELLNQQKIVQELEFEVEQLRCGQRGIEEELKARIEIFDNMNSELGESRSDLGDTLCELEIRNEELQSTRDGLLKSTRLIEQLGDRSKGLKSASVEFKKKIRSLEAKLTSSEKDVAAAEKDLRNARKSRAKPAERSDRTAQNLSGIQSQLNTALADLQDLRIYVNGRKDEWSSMQIALAEAQEKLKIQQESAAALARELDERNSQLLRSREQLISASDHLSRQNAKVRKLSKKKRDLERALHQEAEQEIAKNRVRIAEQSGELAAQTHEIAGLKKDISRIENYSDALRIQLQDQLSSSTHLVADKSKLEAGLKSAKEMIGNLERDLEVTQEVNKEHTDVIENQRVEFERECRQIRFELGAAEETLAGQETLNHKLASDLVDTQGFRRELETLLSEATRESDNSIMELNAQLMQAKQDTEEYKRQTEDKNRTISELMQELSKYTSNIELRSNVENVLQKIDGFRKDKTDTPGPDERDRVARLLIGNADGRELRFPLFKNRLSIGRTSHNDIQLNMQYVSRRHAVISTDLGQTRVIDWGSKNGVFVNDVQVTEQILESGDRVTIGTADFKYEERVKR